MAVNMKDDGDMTVPLPPEAAQPAAEGLKGSNPPLLLSTSDCLIELLANVRASKINIRRHLNDLYSQPKQSFWKDFVAWIQQFLTGQRNPVRLKNLEKVFAHLQVLQHMLAAGKITNPDEICQILTGLLDQLREPENVECNNAWETADLPRMGDDLCIKGIWLT